MVDIVFEDPRKVLRRHDLRPKKSWGQNFLVSKGAVEKIAHLCVDEPGRHVIEIGAGLGTLTSPLLQLGGRVTAVEMEPDMCAVLEAELGAVPGFSLRHADAASFDYAACLDGRPGVVAGNLPYQITGRILRNVLSASMPLLRAVFMMQDEVAARLCAPAGDPARGALSAITQARCDVKRALRLSPGSFSPPPRVRSAVVVLTPLEHPLFEDLPPRVFDLTVKAAFATRRKTLKNSLRAAGGTGDDSVEEIISAARLDPSIRAERLDNAELVRLARAAHHARAAFLEETFETGEEER